MHRDACDASARPYHEANAGGTESSNPGRLPVGVPVPELLTEDEAIVFLRLDVDGPKHPAKTLARYRDLGLLKATRVGRRLRYRIEDLRAFLAELSTLQNP